MDTYELVCVAILGSSFWLSLLMPERWSSYPNRNIVAIFAGIVILVTVAVVSCFADSPMSKYIRLLCYFHFSEYVWVSLTSGKCVFESFLINHGVHYASAFTWSVAEYYIFPYHWSHSLEFIGLILVVVGLLIRAAAMLTAGSAFTHLIAHKKTSDHRLITRGIYGWMRHPGYLGWLIWVTSSQLVLGNILSTITFFVISIHFFKERIEYEERLLIGFFGDEYRQYRTRVTFSGVPFI